ncbi:serine/threonine protein kinase [Plesiocystis pacifica SIR-1]|uniref:Serine/threonine protein kinase n=1 Tax=Plesiocystis pacifica SIR-1 TaxID=391625 RepID=A6GGR9_9BACT|nr:serine/threonine-protein kinase [Plesiocystis pacifica]EDM74916.1 serine/threonine protein kinase [Plesiocystis pacifica SIR-1]
MPATDASTPGHDEPTLLVDESSVVDPMSAATLPGLSTHEGNLGGDPLEPEPDPARIDHYVVLHRLGEGGMGIIFAAYDERLDRKVALKLLRRRQRHGTRLIREAKALAKLSHPNIVQVYEIGSFRGAPYIAMEFVDGVTLGEWLSADARSLADILEVFRAAGRGLAAAHHERLVHRDFKPANVMVRADGRVLVMDFGLARGDDGSEASLDAEDGADQRAEGDEVDLHGFALASSAAILHSNLTVTGTMLGTPAYMAPEQFAGERGDPFSDQFSFCVALWQAVHGERPFVGDNLAALSLAVTTGDRRAPSRRDVPGWLNRAMARGLHEDRAERWPSMEALLEVLDADPERRRRNRLTALGVAGALAATLGGIFALQHRAAQARAGACELEAAAIAEHWDADAREAARAAFSSTELSYADESFGRASGWMDRYAAEWTDARREACMARPPEATGEDPRSACLDEHRAEFATLAEAWTRATPDAVTDAVVAAAELPIISLCADERWLNLRERPPADPATRERVAAIRADLDQLRRQIQEGQREAVRGPLDEALAAAELLGWDPLVSEIQLARASNERTLGNFEAARGAYEAAFFAAGRASDDLRALEAASGLTGMLGMILAEFELGRHWAELAQMLLDRMDLRGATQEARMLNSLGAIQASTGEQDEALASFERALEIWRGLFGEEHPATAKALGNLAVVHMMREELDEAIAIQERALAIREDTLGSQHPDVAHSLLNLGLAVEQNADPDRALTLYGRALAIREAVHGAEHPEVAAIVHAIAACHEKAGDLDEALAEFERALELAAASLPADHPEVRGEHEGIARVRLARGEHAEALEHYAAALDGRDEEAPSEALAELCFGAAQAALGGGELERARLLGERAVAGFAKDKSDKQRAEVEAWLAGLDAPTPEHDAAR